MVERLELSSSRADGQSATLGLAPAPGHCCRGTLPRDSQVIGGFDPQLGKMVFFWGGGTNLTASGDSLNWPLLYQLRREYLSMETSAEPNRSEHW